MANYPGSLPSFTNPSSTDNLDDPSHSTQHININDEVLAIATELGTDPAGAYDTVADRLDAMGSGGGAPTDAKYYVSEANGDLSAEIVLTGLSTLNGLAKGDGAGAFSAITDNSSNWDTAYSHSQDNTQAHTDYLLNNDDDTTSGTITAAGFTTAGNVDCNEIYNTGADLKIQPDVGGDVVLFGDTDVGNGDNGKSLYIYRKAEEGDQYLRQYLDDAGTIRFVGTDDIYFMQNDTIPIVLGYGEVYLNPYADGDVTCFGSTDVGDDEDGKSLYVYRKAEEGDDYMRIYVNQWREAGLYSNQAISLNSGNYVTVGTDIYFFDGNPGNKVFRQHGYLTAPDDDKYIQWQINDTTDNFELTRETADIGYFDIQMPVKIDQIIIGHDANVYLDMSADGNADLVADTNIDLNSPTITFANATKPQKSIYLAAGGATLPTADYAELQDFAGTNFTYRVLAFDKDSDEKCYWTFPIPDNFTGSTVTFTYYWTTDDGGAGETVRWAVDTGGYANDEAWKTGALGGTLQTTDDTWIANGDLHVVTSAAMTCDWTAGDMGVVYLYRDVSGDDLGADVYLIGVKIEYSIGTLGE